MRIRTLLITAATAVVVGASSLAYGITGASASIPAPVKGNITVLAQAPRLVASPGRSITGGETQTVKVAGETFQGVSIPANATGVVLSVSNNQSTGAGQLRVYTTDAGQPGSPTIAWTAGEAAVASITVGLNDTGKLNVHSTVATRYLAAIVGYVTPLDAPPAPVVKTIAPVARKVIEVGGSIRSRSTDFGSVVLTAGTWDARVVLSAQGFNANNNTVPADVFLTASAVLVDNSNAGTPSDPFDFSDVRATVGGVIIPDAQSATLTQDPTVAISQFITLTETTTLHVRGFAYASDSSTQGSGELKVGLDAATFVKIG